jgi:uncharacterized Zn finger protein
MAESARKNLENKGNSLHPVLLPSKLQSWWAKSWCSNLERYADYANRIGRGRSYARNGSVVDLRIETGKIAARVQGSRSQPYKIEIKITSMRADKREELADLCIGKLASAEALLAGNFPQELAHLLFGESQGLFPNPQQIQFSCSCPDWADMCKHVAAALYGIGARFDEDPSLFFALRGINVNDLVGRIVDQSAKELLGKTPLRKGARAAGKGFQELSMDDAELGKLFGLDFGSGEKTGEPSNAKGTSKSKVQDKVKVIGPSLDKGKVKEKARGKGYNEGMGMGSGKTKRRTSE